MGLLTSKIKPWLEAWTFQPDPPSSGEQRRTGDWVNQSCLCAKLLHSCPTLCNPVDCSLPGSSVHGIVQARILEWVAMPSSRGSSQLKDRIRVSCIFCIDRQILYHWATWEAQSYDSDENFINIPKVWGSERFQVGECTCVLGGWHTQNLTWTENPEFRSLLNLPLHTSSFGCSFYPLQYPHNKQVNRMKAFPWVLWSFMANYQTWGESLGKPWFVAKLGKSVSNLVPLYLWLALTVRGAVLWGWIFNLWGIQAVSVRTV